MIEVRLMHQGASRNPKLGQIMSTTLADVAATVYLESQAAHGHSCVFVVPMSETEAAVAALTKSLATAISEGTVAEPTIASPVTMLSVVLEDMREHPDVASCVNGTLASLDIKVLAVSMGTRSYSCVVSGGETTVRAVRGFTTLSTYLSSTALCLLSVPVSAISAPPPRQYHSSRSFARKARGFRGS